MTEIRFAKKTDDAWKETKREEFIKDNIAMAQK
jgi:hypothetical protein